MIVSGLGLIPIPEAEATREVTQSIPIPVPASAAQVTANAVHALRTDSPTQGPNLTANGEPSAIAGLAQDHRQPTAASATSAGIEADPWLSVTVEPGDTMAAIFSRAGLSAKTLHNILAIGDATETLKRIHPGQELRFRTDRAGRLTELVYEPEPAESLHIQRQGDQFVAKEVHRPLELRLAHASATISDSLYLDGQRAGLSDRLILELAKIFGWDVDFALDIRAGDSFALLYEEQYLNGEKVEDGRIVAAEFVNQGQVFRAVAFTEEDGHTEYYTPEGMGMRKAFLRSPVDFRRISSGFRQERFHPVLGVKRPHRGVDYAAATGTPIWASGDGKVAFIGKKGGYGNAVILQHAQGYSTLYGHMSRFAKGLRQGNRVRQGQVLGYVGATGLATGPHLHYEFRVNGQHRNPLTVKLPKSLPISTRYRAKFLAQAQQAMTKLETVRQTSVALQARH